MLNPLRKNPENQPTEMAKTHRRTVITVCNTSLMLYKREAYVNETGGQNEFCDKLKVNHITYCCVGALVISISTTENYHLKDKEA